MCYTNLHNYINKINETKCNTTDGQPRKVILVINQILTIEIFYPLKSAWSIICISPDSIVMSNAISKHLATTWAITLEII